MLSDLRRHEILTAFQREVDGGVCKDYSTIFDEFIENKEDGEEWAATYFDREEFEANEVEICHLFDDHFFTCEGCGWTLPIAEESGDWRCGDCQEEGECND